MTVEGGIGVEQLNACEVLAMLLIWAISNNVNYLDLYQI
jgi:hypothetical protein